MAHFAQLDAHGNVTNVIVVDNSVITDEHGVEHEVMGVAFCKSLFGMDTEWVQTSYHAKKRGNYAGIGYHYDSSLDAFIPPKPYPSWQLNKKTYQWNAPVPMPSSSNNEMYVWDEPTTSWKQVEVPAAQTATAS